MAVMAIHLILLTAGTALLLIQGEVLLALGHLSSSGVRFRLTRGILRVLLPSC